MSRIFAGIDISDRSVEIVSVARAKDGVVVRKAGRRELPAGVVERGVITQPDALVRLLAGFLDALYGERRGKITVGAALPASVVYAKSAAVPANLSPDMAEDAASVTASEVIPIASHDVVRDVIISDAVSGNQRDVWFAMASRRIAKDYRSVLERAGMVPAFLDAEDVALVRGVGAHAPREPVLVVDVGDRFSMIVLVDRGGIKMSAVVPFGTSVLVNAIEKKRAVPLAQAEAMLRAEGFDPSAGDGEAFFLLQQPANELVTDIRRTVAYAERQYGLKVRGVVLAGGGSLVPGIAGYLGENLPGLALGVAQPFRGSTVDEDAAAAAGPESVLYAEAFGLAVRAMNGTRAGPGMDFSPDAERRRAAKSTSGFSQVANTLTSILHMATKGKKPVKRKKAAAPEAVPAPAPEIIEEAAPAPKVMDMTPPELAAPPAPVAPPEPPPAPAPEPEPIPEPEPEPAPAPVAEVSNADEPDFGLGIGDILRSEESEFRAAKVIADQAKAPAAASSAARGDSDKLLIEDVLGRGRSDRREAPAPAAAAPMRQPAQYAVRRASSGGGRMKTVLLVLLVLALFGASVAGVYVFLKKSGSAIFPPVAQEPGETQEPGGTQVPETPTSVSMLFLAGPAKPAEEPALPFYLSRVVETDVSGTAQFPATGEAAVTAGKAEGTITVTNATSNDYEFVATTRFLSEDGVLFRLKAKTKFPANTTVDAEVVADQAGPEGDIGPSDFTIPGLSAELQKRVTGKSAGSMSGGSGTAPAATEADIAAAKATHVEQLRAEAMANFEAMVQEGEVLLPDLVTSVEISATLPKTGALGTQFPVTQSLRFRALLVPEAAVTAELEKKIASDAASYGIGSPSYVLRAFDADAEVAELGVEAPVIAK